MVEAIRRCHERFATALLTNNYQGTGWRDGVGDLLDHFDLSSKLDRRCAQTRPRFYAMACEHLDISPHEAVFLDDLGINLKSARAMDDDDQGDRPRRGAGRTRGCRRHTPDVVPDLTLPSAGPAGLLLKFVHGVATGGR